MNPPPALAGERIHIRRLCKPPVFRIEKLSPEQVVRKDCRVDATWTSLVAVSAGVRKSTGDQNDAFCFDLVAAIPIRRFSTRPDRSRKKRDVAHCAFGAGAAGPRSLGRGRESGSAADRGRDRAEGEQLYPAPPLATPAEDAEDLLEYGAVRLFIERARATEPDLAPDRRGATTIAAICRRLEIGRAHV